MKSTIEQSRQRPRLAPDAPAPQVLELSNGHYKVRLSTVGGGFSELKGIAVSRWIDDRTRDADGFFIYLRDLDDDSIWSTGLQPTRTAPQSYEFRCRGGIAEILRSDHQITCKLNIFVAPRDNFEIRRCRVTNVGDRPRRIELTSYLEWVLGSGEADNNHPAFSKLFLETQYCAERGAILARRRPRHSDEVEFWGFHSILSDGGNLRDELQFETNRARFIGRGRTLASPFALEPGVMLTGDSGAVLDPIASLRCSVSLDPGQTRAIDFVLGAAPTRAEIEDMLNAVGHPSQVQSVLDDAEGPDSANWRPLDGSDVKRNVVTHSAHRAPARSLAHTPKYRRATVVSSNGGEQIDKAQERLQFENGFGGFSPDGQEYVIRLEPDGYAGHRYPPMPWANVIANEQAGFLVTERGAGYTWSGNSRLNRLSAWHNDPVVDPHSEALWIRDEDAGSFWSPTPGPSPEPDEYRVRHGFGYTIFEHDSHELSQEVAMFMAPVDPVKFIRLRVVNRTNNLRRLNVFSYLQWALGDLAGGTATGITTEYDGTLNAIIARNPFREHYGNCVAFSAVVADRGAAIGTISHTCDREVFLGRNGDAEAPAAIVSSDKLDGRAGSGLDPCAAWQLPIEVSPGSEFTCTFLVGEAADREAAGELIRKFGEVKQVDLALESVKTFWQQIVSAITIETPNREIDLLVNGWLAYQNLSCRMWGRSAYYQPGGAYGFRDQLQDSAALIYLWPDITRAQILRHAAQQFVEGDVLHWWHPDTGYGLRTRFSDDLLWLPLIAAEYVHKTGDDSLLDEETAFVTASPLAPGKQEAYLRPEPSGEVASVYEHCCRALDRGLTSGEHGLPLIGCGDWNDGFSRIGRQGKGESVWLGFFIDHVLQQMLPICSERGDDERVARYAAYRQRLTEALNSAGWDGAWYRRAYYDSGEPIGSSSSDECQIDALAQAWAVISGVAPPDRAEMAMKAVENRLICEDAGMIRLLSPPFDRTPNDPGYIKGYLPGIRENGGQYTHGVLWVIRAMAELGRGTRASQLLQMLTPVWHTSTSDRVAIYQTEPYSVAADIYGQPPHVGRGGWTWYTGSAGWMFRVAVESIFGMSIERGETLVMKPAISSAWPQCKLTYRLPDGKTSYEITLENPDGNENGVSRATLDGEPAVVQAGVARVPLVHDGRSHRVVIRM